jgi:hypothetical protein
LVVDGHDDESVIDGPVADGVGESVRRDATLDHDAVGDECRVAGVGPPGGSLDRTSHCVDEAVAEAGELLFVPSPGVGQVAFGERVDDDRQGHFGLCAKFVDVLDDTFPADEFDVACFELGGSTLGLGRPLCFDIGLVGGVGIQACQEP